jgi:hypothetical protein
MRKISLSLLCFLLFGIIIINSCSKGGGGSAPPPNPCTGVTITVNAAVVNVSAAAATDGSLTATATGGSGFTFSINGTTFQASGTFNGLAAGSYTITAKTGAGCTGSKQFTVGTTPAACAGVGIVVTAASTNATPCVAANGTITATATGSTGFTFSINGTAFQASGNFANVAEGAYTVTAKDANGCTGTTPVNVGRAPAGPLFTAVRTLLDNNCVTCHNNAIANGGMNWTIDCNLVTNKDRIKARAVDNTPTSMPPTGALGQADKDKITNWINAGGRFTD